MIDLSVWFMFPVSILISTIAMMSGIGGAIMFSPIFMLVLGLDAVSAFATGLLIELFGFTSGVIGYLRKKQVNFFVVKKIGIIAIPSVIIGVFLARIIPSLFLKLILAVLLLYLSLSFLMQIKKCHPKHPTYNKKFTHPSKQKKYILTKSIAFSTALGGLLLGSISSGLGEVNEYTFLRKMRMSLSVASATSVFLVAISAFTGIVIHTILFIVKGGVLPLLQLSSILFFVLPGVVIGAQIGVSISSRINVDKMNVFIGSLFMFLFIMVLVTLF